MTLLRSPFARIHTLLRLPLSIGSLARRPDEKSLDTHPYTRPLINTHTHTHKPENAHWKIERIEGSGGEEAFIHVLDSRSAHTLHQEMGKSRKPGTRAFTTAGRGAARRYHLLLVSSSVSPFRESRMLAVISANYIRRALSLRGLDAAVVAICL